MRSALFTYLKIYLLVISFWTHHACAESLATKRKQRARFLAYSARDNLDRLIENPSNDEEVSKALSEVKKNWNRYKGSGLERSLLAKASKLKKLKLIIDGFGKCMSKTKNHKILALALVEGARAVADDNFISTEDCYQTVLADLAVINEDEVLKMYAPIRKIEKEKGDFLVANYPDIMKMNMNTGELKKLNERIKAAKEKKNVEVSTKPSEERIKEDGYLQKLYLEKKSILAVLAKRRGHWLRRDQKNNMKKLRKVEKTIAARKKYLSSKKTKESVLKEALKDDLYEKVRGQMSLMHGVINYAMEGEKSRTIDSKVEESVRNTCIGCSSIESKQRKIKLRSVIEELKKNKIKPVNNRIASNRFSNQTAELIESVYKSDIKMILNRKNKPVQRGPNVDIKGHRIFRKYKPNSNIFPDKTQAFHRKKIFEKRKRELLTPLNRKMMEVGAFPNIENINVSIKKVKNSGVNGQYRLVINKCDENEVCSNLFEKEPQSEMRLQFVLNDTFFEGKPVYLDKFKKQRLRSIESAMNSYEELNRENKTDKLLDKLITHNPIAAGELLAEKPEAYLELICERVRIIGDNKGFHDDIKEFYLGATTALIIGSIFFMGPIAAAPLAGKVLSGAWFSIFGASAIQGSQAYKRSDLDKAGCYTKTGGSKACDAMKKNFEEQKLAITFAITVPGITGLRAGESFLRSGNTGTVDVLALGSQTKGRAFTVGGIAEGTIDNSSNSKVKKYFKSLLSLDEAEYNEIPEEQKNNMFNIYNKILEKKGERGLFDLKIAVKMTNIEKSKKVKEKIIKEGDEDIKKSLISQEIIAKALLFMNTAYLVE